MDGTPAVSAQGIRKQVISPGGRLTILDNLDLEVARDTTLRALATEKGRPEARSSLSVASLNSDRAGSFVRSVPSRSET
jgi:hypothetical protein